MGSGFELWSFSKVTSLNLSIVLPPIGIIVSWQVALKLHEKMSVIVFSSVSGTCSIVLVFVLSSHEHQAASWGLRNCYSILIDKSTGFLQVTGKTLTDSQQAACPGVCPQQPLGGIFASVDFFLFSRVKVMSPPGKVPRKENLGLQCEWGSCSFVCSAMEEFCEHVTQHLQQHLHGPGEEEGEEEEDDPLGKGAGHKGEGA